MLVVMTVDHLDLYGPIYRFTYEPFGFVSAAEGFVLVSGIVAGLVYSGSQQRGGLWARVWRRARVLWRYHLILVVGLLAHQAVWASQRPEGGLAGAAWQAAGGALLVNQEPPLDILPLYIVFVLSLPLLLRGFDRGHAGWITVACATLWFADQCLTPTAWYPWTTRFELAGVVVAWQPNHFHLPAWMVLFSGGAYGGWLVRRGRWRGRAPMTWLLVGLVAAGILLALRHGIGVPELSRARLDVGRPNLGWLRLLNVVVLAWCVVQIGWRHPRLVTNRWLELLGRHALLVFTWQTLLQLFLRPVYLDAVGRWGDGVRGPLVILALASLTLPAWWKQRRAGSRDGSPM